MSDTDPDNYSSGAYYARGGGWSDDLPADSDEESGQWADAYSGDNARTPSTGARSGGQSVFVLLLPPFIPPILLVWTTGTSLAGQGWNLPAVLATCTVETIVLAWIITTFYRIAPPILTSTATTVYLAASYGWAISLFNSNAGLQFAAAVLTGVIGYFVGLGLAGLGRGASAKNSPVAELLVAASGVALCALGPNVPTPPEPMANVVLWCGTSLAISGFAALTFRAVWVYALIPLLAAALWAFEPQMFARVTTELGALLGSLAQLAQR